jgi:hypothetical protein
LSSIFEVPRYSGSGSGHVYCAALGRAPRRTVEYACAALGRAASLRNLLTEAGWKAWALRGNF